MTEASGNVEPTREPAADSARASTSADDRTIVMSRTIEAPRSLVWDAWMEPHHVAQWWGPLGFSTTTHEMDVRTGGVWRFIMHGPDGTDYPNRVRYREVVRPERLVYVHDDDGLGEHPAFDVVVNFAERAGKTEVTLRMTFPTVADRDAAKKFGAVEGGNQTLGRLAEYVASL